jgi:hypothetical protein
MPLVLSPAVGVAYVLADLLCALSPPMLSYSFRFFTELPRRSSRSSRSADSP